ncbi:MAG: nucleotidyltransferase family protein [Cyanobacteria bacterium J06621_12]
MDNISSKVGNRLRKLPDLSYGKEWALLELITLGLYSNAEQEMFANLLRAKLDTKLLIKEAKRQKIITLLAYYVLSERYIHNLPADFAHKSGLKKALFVNKHKINFYRHAAADIVRSFNLHNIRFVATKGISFESSIYPGNGSRSMGDVDFMILPQDRNKVSQVLAELGYKMGEFNCKTQQFQPHSRTTMIKYKLNPDHLPSHVLLTNHLLTPYIEVDVANSLTWTLCPFQIPTEVALEKINHQNMPKIDDVLLPVFCLPFQLIFTILHLFKEAWIEITLEMEGKDVNLSKFSDVIRLWRSHCHELDIPEFVGILEEYSLTQPVLWVLEHLDRTFNLDTVATLGLQNRVTDSWLYSASNSRQWQGTMRERLAVSNRDRLFVQS